VGVAGTIGGVTSEETASVPAPATPAPAAPATFRAVPLPALVGVGFVAIGVSPIAFLGGSWWLFFLIPLALAWWVVRTRTVVDGAALRVVSAVGTRRVGWDEVTTLQVVQRGWVRAVRGHDRGHHRSDDGADDRGDDEVALVGVRTRDLGRVAAASGGRITMPTPEDVEAAREHERELEATRLRIARLREARGDGAGEDHGGDGEPRA
jgi:hypothetical protein